MQTLYLFANSRALQQFYTQHRELRLPEAMLWSAFLRRFFVCEGAKNQSRALPSAFRKIFLSSASANVDVSALEFDSNFLAFLQDGDFIFPFLDELATSNVSLEELEKYDTYDEYGDHLHVLRQLLQAYLAKLSEYGFVDSTLQKGHFVAEMLDIYERIEFFVDGFLSVYERTILAQIALRKPLLLHFSTDGYNLENLIALSACALVANHRYTLDFGTKQILHAEPIATQPRHIAGYAFSNPLNQAALCFDTIAQWVQSGIDAEDIVIVLPDESFKDTLRLFDTHRNLNYAMGQSQSELPTYQTLQSLRDFLRAPDELGDVPQTWRQASAIDVSGLDALHALGAIFCEDDELTKTLEEFCMFYAQIAPLLAARTLDEMLTIVLLELDSRRVDDVGGGKVRVMGILETRGVAFRAVIVLNMNEGLVPRPNDKELFLNTAIRKAAHLPTHKDRENLQKHYYYALLRASEHAILAWIENDDNNESSLVLEQEMGDVLQIERRDGEALYKHSLFGASREIVQEPERFALTLPSDFRLSFSKIQSFRQCPNQFYYRYIEQLEAEDNGNAELGLLVHRALAHAYKTQKTPKERERAFYATLAKAPLAGLQRFDADVIGQYLRAFFASEQNRYDSGARTHAIEQHFYFMRDGFGIEGVIDRIDIEKDGSLHVIDYKLKKHFSHKTEDAMQLAIYAEALKNRGAAEIQTSFYDLYQNRLIAVDCTQGAALLAQTLQDLKGTIEIAPKTNPACRYCAYKAICGLWR